MSKSKQKEKNLWGSRTPREYVTVTNNNKIWALFEIVYI